MSNIIHPPFGAGSRPKAPPRVTVPAKEYLPLRIYGKAAGFVVALINDDAAPEGPLVKVVVGAAAATEFEAVAILPNTPEGVADADMAAMAILRTLELIEGKRGEVKG